MSLFHKRCAWVFLVAGFGALAAWGQEKQPAGRLPEAVVAAWEKAGAEAGWMVLDREGFQAIQSGGPGVYSTRATDAGLKQLAGLQHLEHLNLGHNGKVTDTGLKELAGLRQLKTLNLQYIRVTDAGLKHLAGLGQLQGLKLENARVT